MLNYTDWSLNAEPNLHQLDKTHWLGDVIIPLKSCWIGSTNLLLKVFAFMFMMAFSSGQFFRTIYLISFLDAAIHENLFLEILLLIIFSHALLGGVLISKYCLFYC